MLANVYEPFGRWFKPRRVRLFYDIFAITKETKVLDLGGGPVFWKLAHTLGLPLPRVTVLNIRPVGRLPSPLTSVIGDAKAAPFDNFSFDIAFSNSLIEHLVDWESQRRFAAEVARLARSYFVQTPDKLFPVEPHYVTPLIHWFPVEARRRLIRNFSVWGMATRPSQEYVDQVVAEIRLLGKSEMVKLFPEAEIKSERFLGLSKSLVAWKKQN
jgi:hypothetical protein